jgi:peptidoglycan/xylan/chitin deacetylase (PgdA/CDA1 family)
VLFTFDDCYDDLPDAAHVLREEGVGALAFAVSGLIGADNAWDRHYGGPPLRLLDSGGLRRLRDDGFEVGGHSRTHRVLTALSAPEVEAEVHGCVQDLSALDLGPVRYFAYPYGEHDDRVRRVVMEAGHTVAFTVAPGLMRAGTDHMQVPRIEILSSDRGVRFLTKAYCPRASAGMARLYRGSVAVPGRLSGAARRPLGRLRRRLGLRRPGGGRP